MLKFNNYNVMPACVVHGVVERRSKEIGTGWIKDANALLDRCEKESFPTKYSNDIKMDILDCYSFLLTTRDERKKQSTDFSPAYRAYNSLKKEKNLKAYEACSDFLWHYLSYVKSSIGDELLTYCDGISYAQISQKWSFEMHGKYIGMEDLDFKELQRTGISRLYDMVSGYSNTSIADTNKAFVKTTNN